MATTLRTLGSAAARLLLGLFVLVQVVFLLAANASNVVNLTPESIQALPGAVRRPLEHLNADGRLTQAVRDTRAATQRWADLTGQTQSWALFAPDVAEYIPFITLELRWDDLPPCLLRSPNEPANVRGFFRVGRFRLRRYESTIDVSPTQGRPFDPDGESWRACVARAVQDQGPTMRAYLAWRLAAFRQESPELPTPTEVILHVRIYRIPPPPGPRPWEWDDLGLYPVARWRPPSWTLETYDPRTGDFARGGFR